MPAVGAAVWAAIGTAVAEFSIGTFLVNTAISAGLSAVIGALSKKPKAPSAPSFAADRTVTVREAVASRPIIDGCVRTRGIITFMDTTGSSNEYLHMVLTLTGHQVARVGDLFFDGVRVPLDGSGNATGHYAGFVFVEKNLGTPDQAAFADLVSKSDKWTTNHRQRGCAGCHVRLKHSLAKFPNGVPNITWEVDGRFIFDPRDTPISIVSSASGGDGLALITTSAAHGLAQGDRAFLRNHAGSDPELFSDYYVQEIVSTTQIKIWIGSGNTISTGGAGGTLTKMIFGDYPPLLQASYLTDRDFGLGAVFDDEINETVLVASANTCDEEVAVTETANTFTVDAATDECTQDSASPITLVLGDRATLSTTGVLPGGLAPGDYYIRTTAPDKFKLASSRQNALDCVFVDLTSAGSGVHTVTRKTEPRYTACGVSTTAEEPHEFLGMINAAMAGIVPYMSGEFHILAGEYRTPTITLDEGDLRGDFDVISTSSRREAFNAVKGVYVAPQNRWQPADYPPVKNATYEAEDGELIWQELDLGKVISPTTSQRLAKIELERGRGELTIPKYPCKLSAFTIQTGDVISLDSTLYEWAAKPFEVLQSRIVMDEDEDGNPVLGVDLTLKETSSSAWSFAASEETSVAPAPETNLPDPTPTPPTDISVTTLNYKIDASVNVLVTAPLNTFVTEFQYEYRKANSVIWIIAERTPDTQIDIFNLETGGYYFRVAGVNDIGAISDTYVESGLVDIAVPGVMPRVSGLELRGGAANASEFTGRDAKFVWRESSLTRSYELSDEPGGGDSGAPDVYFAHYQVRILSAAGVELRREKTINPFWDYTLEKNIEDNGGTPVRSFILEVYQVGNLGQISEKPARLSVSNPAPSLPTAVSTGVGTRHLSIQYTPDTDPDWDGLIVWMSTSTGFTPSGTEVGDGNCVFRGNSIPALWEVASPNTNYYVVYAGYDAFGRTGLTQSSEILLKTAQIGADDIADGIVSNAKIVDLIADKLKTGTIGAEQIKVGSNTVTIDGAENNIVVTDEQTTPQTRVKLGKTGLGVADYGLEIFDSAGNVVMDVDGLGVDIVKNANLAADSVWNKNSVSNQSANPVGNFTDTTYMTVALTVGDASNLIDVKLKFSHKSTGSFSSFTYKVFQGSTELYGSDIILTNSGGPTQNEAHVLVDGVASAGSYTWTVKVSSAAQGGGTLNLSAGGFVIQEQKA